MPDEVSFSENPPPITPREQEMYVREYIHGASLFQKALGQYVKSDNPYQQAEFEKVMKKAMQVLNETANGLNSKSLLEQNKKIEEDFDQFTNQPKDVTVFDKLRHDLDQAKKSIT